MRTATTIFDFTPDHGHSPMILALQVVESKNIFQQRFSQDFHIGSEFTFIEIPVFLADWHAGDFYNLTQKTLSGVGNSATSSFEVEFKNIKPENEITDWFNKKLKNKKLALRTVREDGSAAVYNPLTAELSLEDNTGSGAEVNVKITFTRSSMHPLKDLEDIDTFLEPIVTANDADPSVLPISDRVFTATVVYE